MAREIDNLTGREFGRLIVKRLAREPEYMGRGEAFWHCECSCGGTICTRGSNLKRPTTRSCGCLKTETSRAHGRLHPPPPRKARDLAAEGKFGMLTPMERVHVAGSKKVMWRCVCDCGRETITRASSLVEGDTQSCGCFRGGPGRRRRRQQPPDQT